MINSFPQIFQIDNVHPPPAPQKIKVRIEALNSVIASLTSLPQSRTECQSHPRRQSAFHSVLLSSMHAYTHGRPTHVPPRMRPHTHAPHAFAKLHVRLHTRARTHLSPRPCTHMHFHTRVSPHIPQHPRTHASSGASPSPLSLRAGSRRGPAQPSSRP